MKARRSDVCRADWRAFLEGYKARARAERAAREAAAREAEASRPLIRILVPEDEDGATGADAPPCG